MTQLIPTSNHYLLEVSVDDLHRQSRTWLSEIEFWRLELAFYQQLLEKINRNLPGAEEKKRQDHFQHLLPYFQDELLDQYEHDIREHETLLRNMIQEKAPFDEQLYREKHKKYEAQLEAFGVDFKGYRKDLYAFAQKYI
ncbi:MAG: hypothetical protein ACO1NZ_00115 [Adhaeribacter sp.]